MDYTKPEVIVLGDAVLMIEQFPYIKGQFTASEVIVLGDAVLMIEQFPYIKGQFTASEVRFKNIPNPAYDLDE